MRKIFFVLCAALWLCPSSGNALEITRGEVLSLEECLEIARERHPDLRSSEAVISGRESEVAQAGISRKPGVNFSSSYSRRSLNDDGYDSYSSGVTMSQLISDWGKTTGQVAVAEQNLEASRFDYSTTLQNLLYDVKKAYYTLLQARKEREVAEEAVKMYTHHLEQARGYYEVGQVSKIDVTTAEVDLSKANLERIRANTLERIARASLVNALGYPEAPAFEIEDILTHKSISITRKEALSRALEARPDLKAQEARQEKARESLGLAAKTNAPDLSLKAQYAWGDKDFTGESEASLGITFEMPLYDGGLTKEKIRQAEAELEQARAELEALRQDVILGVEKAFLAMEDAEQAIETAEKTVHQAKENLDLANGRYEVGVGSPVEVTDATENYINARNDYHTSLYEYRSALAALEKAMGGDLR